MDYTPRIDQSTFDLSRGVLRQLPYMVMIPLFMEPALADYVVDGVAPQPLDSACKVERR